MRTFNSQELEDKTVVELRELCRDLEISGMSKARKNDIIDAISTYYDEQDDDYYQDDEVTKYDPDENDDTTDNKDVPYINAHVHSFLKDNEYKSLVTVSCGAASSNYPVVGKSVGFVKALYREILNIDTESTSVVNGEKEADSYILKSGDVLEFVRTAGQKG